MRRFDLGRDGPNAVGTIAVILVVTVIVFLIRRGTAWYLAMLLGFGTTAVFSSLALLIGRSSRKFKS